ncbi:hypothetical protein [Eggerthia catenaformis]|uniref:hypothetical protein n=1 Tax=Eggerthia catenaformis TaxID=31973 RepID=UPI0028F0EF5C|nr:hypothetical protein [Eggerthia catenaformis]
MKAKTICLLILITGILLYFIEVIDHFIYSLLRESFITSGQALDYFLISGPVCLICFIIYMLFSHKKVRLLFFINTLMIIVISMSLMYLLKVPYPSRAYIIYGVPNILLVFSASVYGFIFLYTQVGLLKIIMILCLILSAIGHIYLSLAAFSTVLISIGFALTEVSFLISYMHTNKKVYNS